MIILNRRTENKLLLSDEKVIHFGITAKTADKFHAGHVHVINELRSLEPDATIMLKVYEQGNSYRCAISGQPSYDRAYDAEGTIDWASDKVDYLLEARWQDHQPFGPDQRKIIASYILPTFRLDMNTDFEEAVIEADAIIAAEGIQHSDSCQFGMVRYFLIGILLDTLDYPIRAGGAKDLFINTWKKLLFEKYANKTYHLINEVSV